MSSINNIHDYKVNHATIQTTGLGEGEKGTFLRGLQGASGVARRGFAGSYRLTWLGNRLWDDGTPSGYRLRDGGYLSGMDNIWRDFLYWIT